MEFTKILVNLNKKIFVDLFMKCYFKFFLNIINLFL